MGENGKFTGGSFPEGTIGTSIFEDMWPRHDGMPQLDELVDAALNARGNEKTNGTWDDKLWDKKELRRLRGTAAMTPRQLWLISLGEQVVALVKSARDFGGLDDAPASFGMAAGIASAAGLDDVEPDGDEVNVDEPISADGTAAALVIANALWHGSRAMTLDGLAAVPGIATALANYDPLSFSAALSGSPAAHVIVPSWASAGNAEEQARWRLYCRERAGFDFYYRLRIACGLDDASTQPWAILSGDRKLQARLGFLAGDPMWEPAENRTWQSVIWSFVDRLDIEIAHEICGMNDWVFANAIAGDMIERGDPFATKARESSRALQELIAQRTRRRERDVTIAAVSHGSDEAGVEALMDEMERVAAADPIDLYSFISSDVVDIETVGIQLRAAGAIANASKADGEVWAALFLSAAEAIIGSGPLFAIRRDLGADWWEETLEEAGVARRLAATAWDAAERTSPLPMDQTEL